MILSPKLPPKAGYVEVETPDGERVYEKTSEQIQKETLEAENLDLKTRTEAIQEVIDGILMGTITITGGGTT